MMETKPKILKIVSICMLLLFVGFTSDAQICAITITDSTVGICNVNGTPFDPADDTYPVTVNASVINTPSTQFNVSVGTNTFGPFDYNIGGVVNLPPDGNVYTLIYSDADNVTCSSTTTVTQTPCCQIDLTTTTFPETFTGGNNGEIQLCINSGVEPFNIVVFPATNASIYENPGTCLYNYIISGLAPDSYSVTITDANDCVTTLTNIDINTPPCTGYMLSNVQGGATSCNGTSDGTLEVTLLDAEDATSITVEVGQGIPPMTFTNLSEPLIFEDLPAGSYDVALFDNNGCEVTYLYNPVVVSEPAPITMLVLATDVTAVGETDGEVQVCVSGANNGFTVTTNPPITTITSNDNNCFGQEGFLISELPIGTYEIIATDPNGCEETVTVIINDPTCPLQIDEFNITNIICGGENTGALDIDISGGTEPYTISLDNGQTFSAPQTSTNFLLENLEAGGYDIIIADATGCSISQNGTTIQETAIITMDPSITHVSTMGLSDGAVSICIEGGLPDYTVAVSPNTGTLEMGGNAGCTGSYFLSDLIAGIYEITVTDDLGCNETFEVEILEPSCLNFTINEVTLDSVSCFGANDGAVTIDLTPGGTPPFTYEITGVQTVTTIENSYTFAGLDNGPIEIFVYDSLGCFAPLSMIVGLEEPEPLMSVISVITPCPGESNGIMCLVPEGGTGGDYSYTVYNVSEEEDETVVEGTHPECIDGDFYVENLAAGEYHVELVDAKGCIAHTIFMVSETMISTSALIGPDCSAVDVGTIDFSYGGGTAPYTFQWSNGETTEDLTGLVNGNYAVTLTDARGCTAEAAFDVSLVDLELDFNLAATCIEQSAGAIITVVNNGVSNYDLMWSGNGATGDILGNTNNLISLSGLDIGTYDITVTDSRGCVAQGSTAVPEYDIVADMVVLNTCVGQTNGFVGATPSTGIPNFNYVWSDGTMGGVISDLPTGTYSVTITDLNGCSAIGEGMVEEYELIPTFEVTDVCSGDNTGTILTNVENAEGVVSYSWSNGGVTNPLFSVEAGTYEVTITDGLGCSVTGSAAVNEFDSPTATASEDVVIEQGESTTVSVDANGGSSPYTYEWTPSNVANPNAASTAVTPDVTTTYTVVVTDANGCSALDTVLVTVVPEVLVVMPTAFSPNGDTNNEIYEPFIPNADAEITTFQIFDRWGKLVHSDASTPWNGKFKDKDQPVGTYIYVVEYLDLLNRKEMLKGHFNLIR